MADNLMIENKVGEVTEETSNESDNGQRNHWVSFEEEPELPLISQPSYFTNKTSSENYVKRLEQKLHRIRNPANITSKHIVTALSEAKRGQMNDLMENEARGDFSSQYGQIFGTLNDDEEIKASCCCIVLYSRLVPKRARTKQEIECLLDEDELAIINCQSNQSDPDKSMTYNEDDQN